MPGTEKRLFEKLTCDPLKYKIGYPKLYFIKLEGLLHTEIFSWFFIGLDKQNFWE